MGRQVISFHVAAVVVAKASTHLRATSLNQPSEAKTAPPEPPWRLKFLKSRSGEDRRSETQHQPTQEENGACPLPGTYEPRASN